MAKRDAGSALRKAQAEIVSLKTRLRQEYELTDALRIRIMERNDSVSLLTETVVMDGAKLYKAEKLVRAHKVINVVLAAVVGLLTGALVWLV